jgi:16S rRNA (uracil1498-N3)-methyltransferase
MRSRVGNCLTIQYPQSDQVTRYECEISVIADMLIQTTIVCQTVHVHQQRIKHLVIAMSNKRDKMELIVQKATECGISQITIVPMQRSIIRICNSNKWKRLESIMIEAVEQSWSEQVPLLGRCDDLSRLTIS